MPPDPRKEDEGRNEGTQTLFFTTFKKSLPPGLHTAEAGACSKDSGLFISGY
jgi:hypothetical protein